MGVEEEFLVMDAHLDNSRPTAAEVLMLATPLVEPGPSGSLVHEFQQQQLEANTSPHRTMASLAAEVEGWRRRAATAAREAGALLVASGTTPIPTVPLPVHNERFDRMAAQFGIVSREHLTCGCHVHVSVESDEEAIGVLDRIRVWLPALLALSANSPYWQGEDTDYAAYRPHVMGRWPATGPLDVLGSAGAYRHLVDSMIATGVLLDEGMVYFDARCSAKQPTVEIRVPDVCLYAADAVLLAALCRGLVETAARDWAEGVPPPAVPTHLVRLASWRASRWGLEGDLLDPLTSLPNPAPEVVAALVEHVRPVLRETGDEKLVESGIERLFRHGNGAVQQRRVFEETGRLDEVVAMLARETVTAP